jgi:hypothetical protein
MEVINVVKVNDYLFMNTVSLKQMANGMYEMNMNSFTSNGGSVLSCCASASCMRAAHYHATSAKQSDSQRTGMDQANYSRLRIIELYRALPTRFRVTFSRENMDKIKKSARAFQ